MKKIVVIFYLIVISICIYGCATNNENHKKDNSTEESEDIAATSEAEKIMDYTISYKKFDTSYCCKALLHNYDNTKEPKKYDNGLIYIENNDEILTFVNGDLNYSLNGFSGDLEEIIRDGVVLASYSNSDYFNNESDIKGKIKTIIEKKIKKLCLNEDETLQMKKIMIRDKEAMLSIVKQLESQGSFVSDNLKNENNYKDGTYTYILYEINKNIPLMGAVEPQQGYEVDIFTPQASFISVLCYNDKLISIDAQGLYDYKELKKRKIISKKEAIAIANKELNSLSPNNTYQIDKAYIEYVEIPDYTSSIYLPKKMQPYWCIILKNALNDVRTYRINAYTGGDLSYGE